MELILSIIAIVLVIYGIVSLFSGAILQAIVCFILAALIGPGGISLLS